MGKHVPKALLKLLDVSGLQHFVLTDDVVRLNCFAQPRVVVLLARDAGEHHAVPPRESQLALVQAAGLNQLRVALQCVDDLDCAKPSLRQWAHDDFDLSVDHDVPSLASGLHYGFKLPVFGFQNQDAAPGMHDHKVWMRLLGTDRHVIPKQIVVIKLLLQPLGQSVLAGGLK